MNAVQTRRNTLTAAAWRAAGLVAGCASDRAETASHSTLGTDLRQVPRGTTTGPAGFGVDLVSYPPAVIGPDIKPRN
jgi:hypothetical protein